VIRAFSKERMTVPIAMAIAAPTGAAAGEANSAAIVAPSEPSCCISLAVGPRRRHPATPSAATSTAMTNARRTLTP
jgi:hypothetical protein